MRFCSRCGLALSELAEWLAGGALPVKRADETGIDRMSPRRKGMRRAAKLMFFSGVLVPVFLVFSLIFDEGTPLIFPFVIFFIALAMMLYARLFSDKTAPLIDQSAAQTSNFGTPPVRDYLPPATTTAIPNVGRQRIRTNELSQPPSVTDHTTKLLDNE